jgi:filamin
MLRTPVNGVWFGLGDIQIALTSEKGTDVPLTVTDNEDGTFTVDYCAPTPGNYTLNVLYGGVAVPRCPLKVPIQPHVDVSKIKVDGLEPSKFLVNNVNNVTV